MSTAVRALSLYLDTSVIGGYFDAEFMADTRALWRLMEAGRFRFVTSQVVSNEIASAPAQVLELMRTTFVPGEVLELTAETERLAQAYLSQKIVAAGYLDDARHVAIYCRAKLDYLVSWNFRHLANRRRESGFNVVNILHGYSPVRIVAPTFLIHGQDQKGI
jgi:predicted nucleic acid-binding protein